jgi:HK97 family phage portal protein
MAGLLQRLFGRRERRDYLGGGGAGLGLGWLPTAGRLITPMAAENLVTVLAAVQAIAGTIGALPATVYRQTDAGRVPAPAHPVSRLIAAPNEHQTWSDYIEWLLGSTLLWGNGLSEIRFDGAGRPVELVPVPFVNVSVKLLPTSRLVFDVIAYEAPFGGVGFPKRLLQDEVLFLRDRQDGGGYIGRSRLSRAPDAVENALGLQQFTNQLWREGVVPSGILSHPKTVSDPARKRLRADMEEHRGVGNQRKLLMLEEGLKWEAMTIAPEAAEVLNSRKFGVEEIARLFGVPPPILQDYTRNTFSNAATAGQWFGQFTLLPWIKKIEREFSRVMLSGEFALSIDAGELMRGDYMQRWQANVAAVGGGILTANEVRESEGWNRRPDGDTLRMLPGEVVVPKDPPGTPKPELAPAQ